MAAGLKGLIIKKLMLDSRRVHHSKTARLWEAASYESWVNYLNLQIILQGAK
jgi:hypothetical protein